MQPENQQFSNSFRLFSSPSFFKKTIQKSGVISISNGRLQTLHLRSMHVNNKIKSDICSREKHNCSARIYFLKNVF